MNNEFFFIDKLDAWNNFSRENISQIHNICREISPENFYLQVVCGLAWKVDAIFRITFKSSTYQVFELRTKHVGIHISR